MMDYKNKLVVSKSSSYVLSRRFRRRKLLDRDTRRASDHNRIIRANPDKREFKQKPYLIYEDGINITPRNLADVEYTSREAVLGKVQPTQMTLAKYKMLDLKSFDSVMSSHSRASMTSTASKFSIRRSGASIPSLTYSLASADTFSKENISLLAEISDQEEDLQSCRAPSMFRLREDPPPTTTVLTSEFKINLVETDTMFLLQIPSEADSIETENGKEIAESNDRYAKSLEKSKALSHIAVQTTKVFRKHRRLLKPRNNRRNSGSFASVWDMYDTYQELWLKEKELEDDVSLSSRAEGKVEQIVVTNEHKEYDFNFEYCGQEFNSKILNALMIMERLISRDEYRENQLSYQGLLVQDPFSCDVKYNYTLTHLWTFYCNHIRHRTVTSISWNKDNQNIIAVGYGKFKFKTKCDGLVCIWNIKSPSNPERMYEFPDDPVTFVAFSNYRHHILAVTFYSGAVLLIDIIARNILIKANNRHYPLYYPVRQARWFPREQQTTVLITCGKGGRVFRYKKSEFFLSNKIMTLGRPHGKIHGVEEPRKCFARRVIASRQPMAEVLIQHPVDPQIYLVGSSEGCVYVCSVQHRHDYKEIFVAHNGPVYNIQFNPFCSKVFLTCGGDWCIRIWAETVFQPLITLESGMTAVQDALWSPLHSTVIVGITGNFVELWDIRRRVSKPMSSNQTPSKSHNNVLMFSANKFNVCIGDVDGNVHVMALSEMPFSPSYQEAVLVEAINSALITRPEVLHTLRNLGPPFVSRGLDDDYRTKLMRRLNRLHDDMPY